MHALDVRTQRRQLGIQRLESARKRRPDVRSVKYVCVSYIYGIGLNKVVKYVSYIYIYIMNSELNMCIYFNVKYGITKE